MALVSTNTKIDRFALEEHIMECWNVVNDIRALNRQMQDYNDLTPDDIANYLLGLETIYAVKFNQLQHVFETLVSRRDLD